MKIKASITLILISINLQAFSQTKNNVNLDFIDVTIVVTDVIENQELVQDIRLEGDNLMKFNIYSHLRLRVNLDYQSTIQNPLYFILEYITVNNPNTILGIGIGTPVIIPPITGDENDEYPYTYSEERLQFSPVNRNLRLKLLKYNDSEVYENIINGQLSFPSSGFQVGETHNINIELMEPVLTNSPFTRQQSQQNDPIKVFPNPFSDKVSIKNDLLHTTLSSVDISVFNINGVKMNSSIFISENKTASNTTYDLDTSSLKKGLYLIKINTGNDIYEYKLLKE